MSVRWPVSQKTVFDEGRMDAIRQAISEGRYHVDPERLAQKILDL
jgi:flagellar biosynthesis anti-sigma factor FlgM